MLRAKKGLQRNPNRGEFKKSTLEECGTTGNTENIDASKIWTGQKVIGTITPRAPTKSRIAKEALYSTGPRRVFDRHNGSGRPFNERVKKGGAGGHNWGWHGIELGVELASSDELRDIDREFNPTAPEAGEDIEAEEGWCSEEAEFLSTEDEGFSGWEYMIASEWRANEWPGYWEGLECVRALWGDEAGNEDAEPLAHSSWQYGLDFLEGKFDPSSWEEAEGEKRVALQVGGVPKWAETVAWGDRSAERAAFEGVPVTPWGLEPERVNPETHGIGGGGRMPASRSQIGSLPEDGPLGLEALRLASTKKIETPNSFNNPEIKTEVKIDGTPATIGEGIGGRDTARAALKQLKAAEKDQDKRFDVGENVSLSA